ncbi:MAG: sarcosine oxidase subunit gamma [Gammaproteobacteria bacterium]|nr:sarcosine oxidase subunit gamma [Gammaproteobacteria bacterium]
MSESTLCESPLVQINLGGFEGVSGIRLQEIPFQGHLNLRGRPDDAGFLGAVARVLGTELPLKANTFVVIGEFQVYWLGPDEWLIIVPLDQQADLKARLDKALQGIFSSVTDVSSGQTIISIAGINARALIEKGCPIDLHPRVFRTGECAQTRLAKAGILIGAVDDSPTYHIVVRRSFSDYLGIWLLDAAEEFKPTA